MNANESELLSVWERNLICWLFAAGVAYYLAAMIAPTYGGISVGKSWLYPVVVVSIPSVYGGIIGLCLPRRAPWILLLLGGFISAAILSTGAAIEGFIGGFVVAALAPAPAVALSGFMASRVGFSPNARLSAALALAIGTAAIFAFADHMNWVPKIGYLCEYPLPGMH